MLSPPLLLFILSDHLTEESEMWPFYCGLWLSEVCVCIYNSVHGVQKLRSYARLTANPTPTLTLQCSVQEVDQLVILCEEHNS